MVEILLITLLILAVGGIAYWLWKQAPFIPEPFKAVGSWLILVVTIVLVVLQIVRLIKLV